MHELGVVFRIIDDLTELGKENELDDDLTIVKTKVMIDNQEKTLAIVGPKRMEYDKVVSLLDYIKKNLKGKE